VTTTAGKTVIVPLAVFVCLASLAGLWAARAAEEAAAVPVNPFEGRADVVPEGRSLFNQYCSHCHGPNAIQGERPRDLRRLNIRHGQQQAPRVFYETANRGRPDKGMPTWNGILTDDKLWRIFTFLETVQTPP